MRAKNCLRSGPRHQARPAAGRCPAPVVSSTVAVVPDRALEDRRLYRGRGRVAGLAPLSQDSNTSSYALNTPPVPPLVVAMNEPGR